MKFLIAGYHRRTFENIIPAAIELKKRGHDITAVYQYWGKPHNIGYEKVLEDCGFDVHAIPWVNRHHENRLYQAGIFWPGDFDAILIADERQAPACYWHGLSIALRTGRKSVQRHIPVVAMQHGYAQDWQSLKDELRADYFLVWGLYAIDRVQADPRFILTGNPRFDSYDIEDANCCYGYTLVIAWPGDICAERIRSLPPCNSPVKIRRHPDDTRTDTIPGYDLAEAERGVATENLICYADAVICRPSTCALEAVLYGKKVIPWNWCSNHPVPTPENINFLLKRDNATRAVANFMEGVVREWRG